MAEEVKVLAAVAKATVAAVLVLVESKEVGTRHSQSRENGT